MLIEKGTEAYIVDEITDGVVKKATQYICKGGIYTRVGDSVDIEQPYKEIKIHNLKARHSYDADTEILAVNPSEENVEVEQVEPIKEVVEEVVEEKVDVTEKVEPTETYTFIGLKQINRAAQNEICKKLGLKGCTNLTEDERIKRILESQE